MHYLLSFTEGIITFISPCLLPLLPVYITYFAGGNSRNARRAFAGSVGFVIGFTLVFTAMGALAGTLGAFISGHRTVINLICGAVVIVFGLGYLGVFKFNTRQKDRTLAQGGVFFRTFVFGIVFSLGWTPCVSAFLGSALMLAAQHGSVVKGILMLLCYSVGLGIPFVLSALLIDRMKGAFDFIKKNYRVINVVCGVLLIVMGLLMAAGFTGVSA